MKKSRIKNIFWQLDKFPLYLIGFMKKNTYKGLLSKKFLIGENTKIGSYVSITLKKNASLHIGHNIEIKNYAYISSSNKIKIGNDCLIGHRVTIIGTGQIIIEDNSLIGGGTMIVSSNHIFNKSRVEKYKEVAKDIKIVKHTWIGGNCTILPGVSIGDNVVIGAGSVITKDVPDNVIFAGSAAKKIKENKVVPFILRTQ